MIREFCKNWECWFVGSFEPDVAINSLKMIKSFFANRLVSMLKKRVPFRLIGPGANQFQNGGSPVLPPSMQGCHIVVICDPCPAGLREQALRQARAENVPLLSGLDERLLLECYFIPSAWNGHRHQ